MDMEKAREINSDILIKSTEKLHHKLKNGGWSEEEFEVMSQAIDNLKDLDEIHYKKDEKEFKHKISSKKMDAYKDETEFENLVYEIAMEKPSVDTLLDITTVLADHMEDIKVMHPKIYKGLIMKLKELR